MKSKSSSLILYCIVALALLVGCGNAPSLIPPTALPTLMPITTKQNQDTPLTSISVLPVYKGTPLPPVYEPITDESAKSVALLATWNIEHLKGNFIAFSADSNSIIIGQQVWNVMDGVIATTSEENFPVYTQNTKSLRTHYSNDGRFYVKVDKYGNLEFRNVESKTAIFFYLDNASKAFFFPDDENILVAFSDGRIWFVEITGWKKKLIDLENDHTYYQSNLQPQLILDTQKGAPQEIYLSPNNSLMAFTFQENTVQVWNMADLAQLATIRDTVGKLGE